jgi:DNA-binding NarL/FixJ family response regulator
MPELNRVEVTLHFQDVSPMSPVIVLSMHCDGVCPRHPACRSRAYLLKDSAASDLLVAIRAVMRNEGFISPAVVGSVLTEYRKHVTLPLDRLTPRNREVLQMLSSDKSNKEIATELNLSPYTGESHRTKIMERLNFHSITDLGAICDALRTCRLMSYLDLSGSRVPCSVETIKPCSSKRFR